MAHTHCSFQCVLCRPVGYFLAVAHKRCVQGYFVFHTGLGVEDEDTGTDKETNLLKLAGADAGVIAVQMEVGPSHHTPALNDLSNIQFQCRCHTKITVYLQDDDTSFVIEH